MMNCQHKDMIQGALGEVIIECPQPAVARSLAGVYYCMLHLFGGKPPVAACNHASSLVKLAQARALLVEVERGLV